MTQLKNFLGKRAKNKAFWVALVAALLLLVQAIAAVFGFTLDLSEFGQRLNDVINALFGVLVVLGVAVDPTTPGISDGKSK